MLWRLQLQSQGGQHRLQPRHLAVPRRRLAQRQHGERLQPTQQEDGGYEPAVPALRLCAMHCSQGSHMRIDFAALPGRSIQHA